ncbi:MULTISPECIES: AAA family ATPase [unclassified Clostridium]|uniref:AAA family ATPase n=1 Tax=Clostridium TaxID=1485 RepID=UPI001C8C5EB8|nr:MULTISPECIES: AAA family ATPase [unclassified Clostridium]MBX9138772.1 AAA family ATPase [Clostridium sp. K12(2020)]MBX9145561.1 AAA family ATPase [Clostridium sp. K13]MDU4324564.1 AAA family ATPase [Clostridium celatum]
MEQKPLPIGIDNFEKLITRGYYFVDKTLLIKDLLDNKADVNLFTRPRRFGKTLNISMLQYYFEDRRDEFTGEKIDNSYLFEGLNIKAEGEKYTKDMGKYPVINLSLKSAKQRSLDLAFQCIREEISNEFKRHKYIIESDVLKAEKEHFMKIVNNDKDMSLYITALKFLSNCLNKYHNEKVIILIDEYDVPLENAFFEGFYNEMISFIRSLFESALKTNPSLEFSVITGCLRISKESIFTGLNNLKIISILDDRYAEHFGFTDEEVVKICDDYNMQHKYETIKQWFNGYIFGETNVYNPWSVMQYVDDLKANINKLPKSYWANTSSNSIVKSLIERADDITKGEIEALIEGKTIEKPVHEDITYEDVYDNLDNLWNFMFFTGYFKKISERMDENTQENFVELAIPNLEVKYIFRTKILKWFNEKIKSEDLSILYTSIINGEVDVFQKEVNRLLKKTISFNDAYENFYHGFMIGLLSHMDGYIVKSNRETGDGRCDIYIKPLSIFDKAVIIEMKVCDKPKELFTKPQDALQQIEDKKYAYELNESGYEDIIKYGMAFYRKDCLIKIKE